MYKEGEFCISNIAKCAADINRRIKNWPSLLSCTDFDKTNHKTLFKINRRKTNNFVIFFRIFISPGSEDHKD
jgi:hypothetical protein